MGLVRDDFGLNPQSRQRDRFDLSQSVERTHPGRRALYLTLSDCLQDR
jgi:hypothetical protein